VEALFATPGNPGIGEAADLLPIAADDLPGVAEAASDLKIDLTVVGPELPLALGIGDEFRRRGLRLFGPVRDAAQIESSKVFAKDFCIRHNIPTAKAVEVRTQDEAVAVARKYGFPVVFKADGLAAGKGVQIITNEDELDHAVNTFFIQRRFGDAGEKILVEEFLSGEELSYMVIADGTRWVPVATSHDYKRALNGDRGPNTGGMGSHSPAVLTSGTSRQIVDEIVRPTIQGMAEDGREYRGVLYIGLMLTEDGPKVLEYNCRFGDPETQAILLRLDDNLAEVMRTAADGKLAVNNLRWRREAAACVVVAASGYPESPRKGDEITGVDDALAIPGVTIYHAGTKRDDEGRLLTAGGRVLSVCGRGATLKDALKTAYEGVDKIQFADIQYRTDIGADSLLRLGDSSGED
jgi:phosphoribosylamine--glycine ligase